jgi:deglycase
MDRDGCPSITHREAQMAGDSSSGQNAGLSGKKVAILATNGVEASELLEPRRALDAAGATTILVSIAGGEIQAVKHGEKAERIPVDLTIDKAHVADFDALLIPGGVSNPDRLRLNAEAVQFVREFMSSDKPVASICHGPWLLVEADAVAGRKLTSWPSLRTDIRNAGGQWVDREVEVDGNLITSRKPDDLPAFNERVVRVFGNVLADRMIDELSEESFPASDAPPGPTSIGASRSREKGDGRARP